MRTSNKIQIHAWSVTGFSIEISGSSKPVRRAVTNRGVTLTLRRARTLPACAAAVQKGGEA